MKETSDIAQASLEPRRQSYSATSYGWKPPLVCPSLGACVRACVHIMYINNPYFQVILSS